MRDKIRFYSRNEDARKRLAEAGGVKCREAGYGNRVRLKAVLDADFSDREYADLRFGEEDVSVDSARQTG